MSRRRPEMAEVSPAYLAIFNTLRPVYRRSLDCFVKRCALRRTSEGEGGSKGGKEKEKEKEKGGGWRREGGREEDRKGGKERVKE